MSPREDPLTAKFEPYISPPQDLAEESCLEEEEILPSVEFKEYLFGDHGNTSNYFYQKKPVWTSFTAILKVVQ